MLFWVLLLLVTLLTLFPSVFLSSQPERAMTGLANISMGYSVGKISVPLSTALEKVLSFLKQYLQLWVLVAAEVTVAWQDLLASRIALTFARHQPTTCLLHKLLSVMVATQ